MEHLFFRPNAQLSSLFTDTPMEGISIDDEGISETITDYHGNMLVYRSSHGDGIIGIPSVHLLRTLIMSFDMEGSYIDTVPTDVASYSSVCEWICKALLARGWIPMNVSQSGDKGKSVNGREMFFSIKEDEVKNAE